MVEQAPSQIILDLAHPFKEANDWSWFTIAGDECGIVDFLKALASATPRFSLLIPPGVDTDDLTIAKERAQEIIKPSVHISETPCMLLGESVVTLFPSLRPWQGVKQFERFLELSANTPPSLVVLPSRWRRLLPRIKKQTDLRVRVLNERGDLVCRVYIGYKDSSLHKKEGL